MAPVKYTGGHIILFRSSLKRKLSLPIHTACSRRNGRQADRKELGRVGENIAVKFLSCKGYHILKRNWQVKGGEVDIIATKDEVVVFVEVKSRLSTKYGTGEESITLLKRRRLIRAAKTYLRYTSTGESYRFDVISILFKRNGKVKEINHIEDAFTT